MRKSKGTGRGVPCLGVRTRAKTLALERLQSSNHSSSPATAAEGGGGGGSYLQLRRSRRLEKKVINPIVFDGKRHKLCPKDVNLQLNNSFDSEEEIKEKMKGYLAGENLEDEIKEDGKSCKGGCGGDLEVEEETSFGENLMEFDGRERLIKDPDASTRPLVEQHYIENSVMCQIPISVEMEQFFAGTEVLHQRTFVDKYNFDPVTDKPLPGRYEWEKLN